VTADCLHRQTLWRLPWLLPMKFNQPGAFFYLHLLKKQWNETSKCFMENHGWRLYCEENERNPWEK